jgi:hypothetical protein
MQVLFLEVPPSVIVIIIMPIRAAEGEESEIENDG